MPDGPYRGPAPEPRTDPTAQAAFNRELVVADPAGGSAPPVQTPFMVSDPPSNPAMATELAEYKQKYGEALRELGSVRAEMEARLQEIQFETALAMAGGVGQPQAQPQIPQGFTEDRLNEGLTVRDFFGALAEYDRVNTARITALTQRAGANITAEEETAALQRYPALNQLQEPARTQQLVKAVALMRGVPRQNGASASQAPPLTQRVVPLTPSESASNVGAGEPGPGQTEAVKARAEYEAAKQITNPKERTAKMRAAFEKLQAIAGIPPDAFLNQAWVNRT